MERGNSTERVDRREGESEDLPRKGSAGRAFGWSGPLNCGGRRSLSRRPRVHPRPRLPAGRPTASRGCRRARERDRQALPLPVEAGARRGAGSRQAPRLPNLGNCQKHESRDRDAYALDHDVSFLDAYSLAAGHRKSGDGQEKFLRSSGRTKSLIGLGIETGAVQRDWVEAQSVTMTSRRSGSGAGISRAATNWLPSADTSNSRELSVQ